MKKHLLKLSALLLLTAAPPAFAEVRPGTFSISPFVGGFTFDGQSHLETAPTYGIRAGYDYTKTLGVEGVFSYVHTDSTGVTQDVDVFNYHIDGLYHFLPEKRLVPFVAAGIGGMHNDSKLERDNSFVMNWGGGLKYFISDSLALRGDVRHMFAMASDLTRNNLEYTVGLSFLFGGKTPPPPPVPASTLSADPAAIMAGKSSTLSWTSQNATDCSVAPGIGKVSPQGSAVVTPERDTAYTLTCSGPGGTTTSSANVAVKPVPPTSMLEVSPQSVMKGKPATLTWSSQNATTCTIEPGIGQVPPQGSMTINPAADTAYALTCTGAGGTARSAANVSVVEPKKERICITLNIEFETDKADIQPRYHDEIGKVAEFMKKYPEVNGVIEGHTDNVGGEEYNLKLSERRAVSVKTYLVEKYGIDAGLLSTKGYGYSMPVASNDTPEGRQKNRRIQAVFDCVIVPK